jgi:hypothetical protein
MSQPGSPAPIMAAAQAEPLAETLTDGLVGTLVAVK